MLAWRVVEVNQSGDFDIHVQRVFVFFSLQRGAASSAFKSTFSFAAKTSHRAHAFTTHAHSGLHAAGAFAGFGKDADMANINLQRSCSAGSEQFLDAALVHDQIHLHRNAFCDRQGNVLWLVSGQCLPQARCGDRFQRCVDIAIFARVGCNRLRATATKAPIHLAFAFTHAAVSAAIHVVAHHAEGASASACTGSRDTTAREVDAAADFQGLDFADVGFEGLFGITIDLGDDAQHLFQDPQVLLGIVNFQLRWIIVHGTAPGEQVREQGFLAGNAPANQWLFLWDGLKCRSGVTRAAVFQLTAYTH